ncbi:MAG TPA: DUF374 domain-containing protein [Drouetiella sp.]|jgi:lysophospholipid acyltransferase (LPLAT)-like uncharacterized protein
MAKFRVRNILGRVPFTDGLRLSALEGICTHGIRFFDSTYTTQRVYSPKAKELLDSGQSALFAVAHGRMIGLLRFQDVRSRVTILISPSRDGEIISRTITNLGLTASRGSQKQGAVKGGLQMVKAAEAGKHLVVMIDGPRGPAYEVKPGIIKLAEITGLPIIPFTSSSRNAMYMWGWDSFMATHYGSPILHVFGDPIFVRDGAPDDEREVLRVKLERQLESMRTVADSYYKVTA